MSITPKLFTEQDNLFLKENYHIIGPNACSQRLERTYSSICSQACRLGLQSNKFHKPTDILNKICGRCQEEKPKTSFGIDKNRKDGYHPICKTCLEKGRYSRKDKKASYDKQYRQNNMPKIRTYILKNKLKIRHRTTVYQRKWRAIPHNRILQNLRSRMRKALENKKKIFHTIDLLGCSAKNLKIYLESKFSTGMIWDNYGLWHIDHIKPCSSFDLLLPEHQKLCFHYTNLQPLWAVDNLKKGNSM